MCNQTHSGSKLPNRPLKWQGAWRKVVALGIKPSTSGWSRQRSAIELWHPPATTLGLSPYVWIIHRSIHNQLKQYILRQFSHVEIFNQVQKPSFQLYSTANSAKCAYSMVDAYNNPLSPWCCFWTLEASSSCGKMPYQQIRCLVRYDGLKPVTQHPP